MTANKSSSRQSRNRFIVDKKEVRRLFREWANLTASPDNARLKWFRGRYPRFFTFLAENDDEGFRNLVCKVADFLQLAWRETDPYPRAWSLFWAQYHYLNALREVLKAEFPGEDKFSEYLIPGELEPFIGAMSYLQTHLAAKMTRCAGLPCCGTEYFFRSEKGQKYCGTDCSEPIWKAKRDKWWAENRGKGSAWWSDRRKKAKKKALGK